MTRYACAWITGGFLAVSLGGHGLVGGFTVVDDAHVHGEVELPPGWRMMGRDPLENGRPEFLERLWPVTGLIYRLHTGSPAFEENGDLAQSRLAAFSKLGRARGEAINREGHESHERRTGHAGIPLDLLFNA